MANADNGIGSASIPAKSHTASAPLRRRGANDARKPAGGGASLAVNGPASAAPKPRPGGPGGLSDLAAQSDKSVSRETLLSDESRKPYKATSIARLETRAIARKPGPFGGWRLGSVRGLILTDFVEKRCFPRRAKICSAVGSRIERRLRGTRTLTWKLAGDRRSQIVMALNTDSRSQCHLVEFLQHTVLGVFQQYRPEADLEGRCHRAKLNCSIDMI